MRRRLAALLLALALPACRGSGTEGVAVPAGPMDLSGIVRPASPNTALAAPAGFLPAPDLVTPAFAAAPDALYAAARRVALAQPRTWLLAEFAAARQLHLVVRSAVWNFPDLVTVAVTPQGGLVLWSRSIHGYSDLGTNRRRLEAWLAALAAAPP